MSLCWGSELHWWDAWNVDFYMNSIFTWWFLLYEFKVKDHKKKDSHDKKKKKKQILEIDYEDDTCQLVLIWLLETPSIALNLVLKNEKKYHSDDPLIWNKTKKTYHWQLHAIH